MRNKKRVAAIVLAMVMVLSFGIQALAATTSPSKGPRKGYDTTTDIDTNQQDHENKTVYSKISKGKTQTGNVIQVKADKGKKNANTVGFRIARNLENEKVDIDSLGDGKKGIFNTKRGQIVTTAKINSAKRVTIKANAFKGSKVKHLRIQSEKRGVYIKKNAFNGTKVKNLKIGIEGKGQKKKASWFKFDKGAFNGLSSKARIIVAKNAMTKSEYNKLVKKLRAAGFKGKISRTK